MTIPVDPGVFGGPQHQSALDAIDRVTGSAPWGPARQVGPVSPTTGGQGPLILPGIDGQGGYGPLYDALQHLGPGDFPMPPDMNPEFWNRLSGLRQAVGDNGGGLGVFSAARNQQRQGQLYQQAVQHYGDEAAARKVVQPPGKSWHDPMAGQLYGMGPGAIAADLHGHLALAHRLAHMYGLEFSADQPWHVQVAGLK